MLFYISAKERYTNRLSSISKEREHPSPVGNLSIVSRFVNRNASSYSYASGLAPRVISHTLYYLSSRIRDLDDKPDLRGLTQPSYRTSDKPLLPSTIFFLLLHGRWNKFSILTRILQSCWCVWIGETNVSNLSSVCCLAGKWRGTG